MSPRRSLAIARQEARVLRRDPVPLTVLVAMPLIMASIYRSTFRAVLLVGGHAHASGSDFAIPAQIAQFGFFLVPFTGFMFFREHLWKTWGRLRASPATTAEIMVGKAMTMIVVGLVQVSLLIVFGVLVLGFQLQGQLLPLAAVAVVYVSCAVSLGVAVTALVRTSQQLNAVGFLGATVLGAIGGALVPLSTLPHWIRDVAPATPQYWAMRAARDLLLDGRSAGNVLLPITILIMFLVGGALVAIKRFSFDERTVGWS
jgi:ABC-2 type transport system permease protein